MFLFQFGCNDNPYARHFESAWRRLLGQHQITATEAANCTNNDTKFLTVLNCSSRKESNIKVKSNREGTTHENVAGIMNEIDDEEIIYLQSIISDYVSSDEIERHMICYIAAVLQNNIIDGKWYWKLTCQDCLNVFAKDEFIEDDLMALKMKNTTLKPVCKSTFNICLTIEKLMEKFEYDSKQYHTIPNEVRRILRFDDLFQNVNFDNHADLNHKNILIDLIIQMYIKKRQTYISRCNTLEMHDVFLRSKLTKAVHFYGQ